MSHMSQDSVYFSQLFESMNAVSGVDANILTSSDFQCFVPELLRAGGRCSSVTEGSSQTPGLWLLLSLVWSMLNG